MSDVTFYANAFAYQQFVQCYSHPLSISSTCPSVVNLVSIMQMLRFFNLLLHTHTHTHTNSATVCTSAIRSVVCRLVLGRPISMSACLWTLCGLVELPAESNYQKEIAQLASKIESKPNAEMNFKSHKQLPRPRSRPVHDLKLIENLFMASFVLSPICIQVKSR